MQVLKSLFQDLEDIRVKIYPTSLTITVKSSWKSMFEH